MKQLRRGGAVRLRSVLYLGTAIQLVTCTSLALGQETTTYSYDSLGRLTGATVSGGPATGESTTIEYDPADNRKAYAVSTSATPPPPPPPPPPPGPSFSVGDVSATEGSPIQFTVSKSGSSSGSVHYSTANGTATAGSDYTAKANVLLSFTSSETSKTVSITTTDDSLVEGAETLFLNLSSPSSDASIADGQGVGTIVDNDSSNQAPTCNTLNIGPIPSYASSTINVDQNMVLGNCSDADGDTMSVSSPTLPYTINVPANSSTTIVRNHTVVDGKGGWTTMTINVLRN